MFISPISEYQISNVQCFEYPISNQLYVLNVQCFECPISNQLYGAYIFADTVDECANVLNRDLEEMENWAYTWLVTFNAKKTCDMCLSLQTRTNIILSPLHFKNEVIKTVNSHCHLGLTLTSNLKWSAHINNICIKANKRLAISKKTII